MAEQEAVETDAKTTVKRLLIASIRPLFFILLALAVFWFISGQIGGTNSILSQLNETASARGLITFVVAIATVAAAIILLLAAIVSEGTESDVKMRLNEGRQVMAPLIGILGTIVGFYFGQPVAGTTQAQTLGLAPIVLSAERVAPGGTVTVTSRVSGGRSPYTYTITLPGVGQPITDKLTAAGEIRREVAIPKDTKPSDVTIQVGVEDSVGATAGVKSERSLKIAGS